MPTSVSSAARRQVRMGSVMANDSGGESSVQRLSPSGRQLRRLRCSPGRATRARASTIPVFG